MQRIIQKVKISRITAGIIIAGISAISSVAIATITARSQASETANSTYEEFKAKTAGDIKALEGINMQINRRLENIEGSLQTITSKLIN